MTMMAYRTRKASQEVLRKYMNERVPVEKRVEGVYVPTVLTDSACYLMEYIKLSFTDQKIKSVGNILKRIRTTISAYHSQNLVAMHEKMYRDVSAFSLKFYQEFIAKHVIIDQCTYTAELWKQRPEYKGGVADVLGAVYFARMVLEYIIQYERDWTEEVQQYLGSDVRYKAYDNKTCVALLKLLNEILEFYKAPEHLDSHNIQLTYKIFHNKVKKIDVTSIVNK